jgi:hypothetical protein
MCNKLFIEKDCCGECLLKYVPFNKGEHIDKYSREEAILIHKKTDLVYENPDSFIKPIVDKVKNYKSSLND